MAPPPALPAAPSVEPPARPLALPRPATPVFEGEDLSKAPPAELAARAGLAYRAGNYRNAVALEHYAVSRGDGSAYNLACEYALLGEVDAAFYWLQEAAREEGVDASWAQQDTDLVPLRADPRWPGVLTYLMAWNARWASSGHHASSLVVPTGYVPGTPIRALVGLHGMGSNPENFVDEDLQPVADVLGMAIVGISGTVPRGKRSFVWSEDTARDAAHLRRVLAELGDKLTLAREPLVLFGFSQGAQMAFEIAFAQPAQFQGAIAMSPGGFGDFTAARAPAPGTHSGQAFVCEAGADEHPGNVQLARSDCARAEGAGSRVTLKLYPGMSQHTFPPDFAAAFPGWVRFITGR